MRRGLLAILLALGASQAIARDLYVDEDAIRACFAETNIHAQYIDCAVDAANACQALKSGGSTIGIATCASLEAKVWDEIMQEQLAAVNKHFAGDTSGYDFLGNLDAAQKAWVAFRTAQCKADYARATGGSIRSINRTACLLLLNAGRALRLRAMIPN